MSHVAKNAHLHPLRAAMSCSVHCRTPYYAKTMLKDRRSAALLYQATEESRDKCYRLSRRIVVVAGGKSRIPTSPLHISHSQFIISCTPPSKYGIVLHSESLPSVVAGGDGAAELSSVAKVGIPHFSCCKGFVQVKYHPAPGTFTSGRRLGIASLKFV